MTYEGGEKVCIYSHWGGGNKGESALEDSLKRALARRERWDDDSYLARIIFCEVVKKDIDGATGYGLAPYVGEEEYPTIHVNFADQTVNSMPFEDFINN